MEALDDIFALFTKERRRFALYYLENADGPVTVDELAEQVHEWESDPSQVGGLGGEYDEVVISLEHNHLPQLDAADHVEYDRSDQELRITDLSAEADVILSVTKAIEQPSETKDVVLQHLE